MIVKITVMVANIPPMKIADPRKSASSGATGKFIDKQNVTKKNVDDGPAIFSALNV